MRNKSAKADKGSGNNNDSIWAIIAGVAKGYNLTFDYVLHQLSYTNLMMYSSVLPSYDDIKEKKENRFDASLDANNPDNYKDEPDEIVVRR